MVVDGDGSLCVVCWGGRLVGAVGWSFWVGGRSTLGGHFVSHVLRIWLAGSRKGFSGHSTVISDVVMGGVCVSFPCLVLEPAPWWW
jgi:hypothetical protein